MQEFKNVIAPCLIQDDPEKLIIDVIPPPELHLYEHIVTKLADLLGEVNPSVLEFFKRKCIVRHGYNGGGYDGPNCKKILFNLDELDALSDLNTLPSISTLRKFKAGDKVFFKYFIILNIYKMC